MFCDCTTPMLWFTYITCYTSSTAPNSTTTISTDTATITTISTKYDRSENLVINMYPFPQYPKSNSVRSKSHIEVTGKERNRARVSKVRYTYSRV